ncbi:MAG: hypothetical protein ACJAYU_001145 [Bradymonadia bacterium]|jgi:hypothetical protein
MPVIAMPGTVPLSVSVALSAAAVTVTFALVSSAHFVLGDFTTLVRV